MKRFTAMLLLAVGLLLPGMALLAAPEREPAGEPDAATEAEAEVMRTPRFEAVRVYVDVGRTPLAAYQFQLHAARGEARVVGVESGEHDAFRQPPFYDRRAVERGRSDRVIVAAYAEPTVAAAPAAQADADAGSDGLPTGRVRVATVHMLVTGAADTEYAIELQAASNVEGTKFKPTITIEKGTADEPSMPKRD